MRSICLIHHAGIQAYPYLIDTAKVLYRDGWDVDVLALKDAPLPEYIFREEGIRTYRLPFDIVGDSFRQRIIRFSAYLPWAVLKAMGKRYEAFIGFDQNGLMAASFASMKEKRTPVIYYSPELHVSSDLKSFTDRAKKKVEIFFSRRAEAVIIQDSRRAQILVSDNGLKQNKVYIVPNAPLSPVGWGGNSDFLKKLLSTHGVETDKIVILLMGTLADWTLARKLVEMAADFPPECILVAHGWGEKGYIEELRNLSDRQSPRRVIVSTDVLDHDDLDGLTSSADLGLALYQSDGVTNRHEMASGKLYEYLKAGIPVIASDFPALREVVENNEAGICVDSGTKEHILDAVKTLVKDPELRSRCAQRGRQAFIEKYAYERNFGPVLALLNSFCPA